MTSQGSIFSPSKSLSSSIAACLADHTSQQRRVEACRLSSPACSPPTVFASLACGSLESSAKTQSSQLASSSLSEYSSRCQECLKVKKRLKEVS